MLLSTRRILPPQLNGGLLPLFCLAVTILFVSVAPLRAEEAYSLVMNGKIYDVKAVRDISAGHFISAEILNTIAKTDGNVSIATRPERGHIVLNSPAVQGQHDAIQGFKTAIITFVVNGTPIVAHGRLVNGVPYIESPTLQTVLEALKFNVLISHESFLISVFRTEDFLTPYQASQGAHQETAGGTQPVAQGRESTAGGAETDGDMMKAIQKGVDEAMRSLGVPGGYGSYMQQTTTLTETGNPVCVAMDQLRTLWEETEPNAHEKATLRALADKFQQAKDNRGSLDQADVDEMLETLKSFGKKVDRRTLGTREWVAPNEAIQVKSNGLGFLESFSKAMSMSRQMMNAIKTGDQDFANHAEDLIQEYKNLEATIQQQGIAFDKEVVRVRNAYGCGPAKSGLPPS